MERMKPVMPGSIGCCVIIALLAVCSPMQTTGNGSEITNGIVVSAVGLGFFVLNCHLSLLSLSI